MTFWWWYTKNLSVITVSSDYRFKPLGPQRPQNESFLQLLLFAIMVYTDTEHEVQKQPLDLFCKMRSEAQNFIKKETVAQVPSSEFFNTFFTGHLRVTASGIWIILIWSSRSQTFFKIGFLKNFAMCTWKNLYQSLWFDKVVTFRHAYKRDSNTIAFLWILQNF